MGGMVGRLQTASRGSFDADASAAPERRAAEIITRRRLNLAAVRDDYRAAAADALHGAFPAPSRHACCQQAARVFGLSPDTFERISAGGTMAPDAVLICAIAGVYARRQGKPARVMALLAKLGGAA